MYRVLIVDDESYVVDWISDLLERQTEFELDIYRAYSAAEALEWLKRARIDLVISDISMPRMNGIALAEKVRENWPSCKVILLTAYAEFDYALNAIKNDVVSYILKDEDDAHILAEITKAFRILDHDIGNSRLLDDLREQLQDSFSLIQNEVLLNLVHHNLQDPAKTVRQLKSTGILIDLDQPMLLFVGRINNLTWDEDIVNRFRLITGVKRIAAHYLETQYAIAVADEFNQVTWLIQPCNLQVEDHPGDLTSVNIENGIVSVAGELETIQRICQVKLSLQISFALQSEQLQIAQLPESVRRLNDMLDMQKSEKPDLIMIAAKEADDPDRDESAGASTGPGYLPANLIDRLNNCLKANQLSDSRDILEIICGQLESCPGRHIHAALEHYFAAAVAFLSYMNRRKLSDKVAGQISISELFHPNWTGSWKSAADCLRRLSKVLADTQTDSERKLSSNIIKVMKDYLNNHIKEDTSLVRLSEVTGYSTTYLSHLFREMTGSTLNDYIGRLKMRMIEELMLNSNLNIGDIADSAGFRSRTYFNKFVRRMTGLSPQEHRIQVRQKQKM